MQKAKSNLLVHTDLTPTLFDLAAFLGNAYDAYARVVGTPLPPVSHPHLLMNVGPLMLSAGADAAAGSLDGALSSQYMFGVADTMPRFLGRTVVASLKNGVTYGANGFVQSAWYAGAGQLTGTIIAYLTR